MSILLWEFDSPTSRQIFAPGVMVALQVSIERYARESMREVQGSNPCGAKKFMRWNGLLAGFEARSRRVRFPLGAPSFASVDVEKIKPRKLDEDDSEPC